MSEDTHVGYLSEELSKAQKEIERLISENNGLRNRVCEVERAVNTSLYTWKLEAFLYDLMRDHLPLGTVEGLVVEQEKAVKDVKESRGPVIKFTNLELANYSKQLTRRLVGLWRDVPL